MELLNSPGSRLGRNSRLNLGFLRNTLFIDEKFFILLRAESRELSLEVGEDDALVPNFLLQLGRFLLYRFPCNDFIRNLERSCKFVLEANKFV